MSLRKGSNLSQVSHGLTWNFPYKRLLFFFSRLLLMLLLFFKLRPLCDIASSGENHSYENG